MTAALNQRWEEGEARWVAHRPCVNTRALEVALIKDAEARAFVLEHHYSRSYPASRLRIGLFLRGELVGVAVFSEPANVRVIPKWTGYPREEGMELGRYVLLDRVGFNAESFFLARCKRLVREHKPGIRAIVAYSDPCPRSSIDGALVLPGHLGQIYQATNASYRGRATSRKLLLDENGLIVSPRALSKITNQAQGKDYATTQLERASGTSRRATETPREWVKRATRALRQLDHPGNHVYVWGVSRRDVVPKSAPYPKQFDPTQLSLLGV